MYDEVTNSECTGCSDPAGPAARQAGMATAELLGNAALGIGALVVIWGLLQSLGVNVISWMGQQIGIG